MPYSENFDFEKWKEEKIKNGDWLPKDDYIKLKEKRDKERKEKAAEADKFLQKRKRKRIIDDNDDSSTDDEIIPLPSFAAARSHGSNTAHGKIVKKRREDIPSYDTPHGSLRFKDLEEEEEEMEVVLREHCELLKVRKEIKVIIEEPSDPELEIRRELVFDTETTGLSNSDKIVEFSLLELIDGIKTGRRLHYFLNPKIKISKRASEIHGITNEKLVDAPTFADVAEDMIRFIGHGTLIAHNAKFDQRMLNNELESIGWAPYPDDRFIDTLDIARFLYPDKKNNQDALCARFNVDNHNRVTTGIHSAYEDTIQLYHVYGKLCSELEKIDRCSHDFKIKRRSKGKKEKGRK